MLGQMQDWPLLISKFLDHAEVNHPNREIFSMLPEGGEFRAPGLPLEVDGAPLEQGDFDLPGIGGDTEAVLSAIGLSKEAIQSATGRREAAE